MIRIESSTAYAALLGMRYAAEGCTIQHIAAWQRRANGQNPTLVQVDRHLHNLEEQSCAEDVYASSWEAILNNLSGRIAKPSTAKEDGAIIDAIVQAVMSPYARNTLGGPTLDKLKKALLRPDELVGLREKLARVEMSCGFCGHLFHSGESGTCHEENGTNVWACSRCVMPTDVACSTGGCDNSSHMPQRIQQMLNDKLHLCRECAEKKGDKDKKVAKAQTAQAGAQGGDFGRMMREVGRAVQNEPPFRWQVAGGDPVEVPRLRPGAAIDWNNFANPDLEENPR